MQPSPASWTVVHGVVDMVSHQCKNASSCLVNTSRHPDLRHRQAGRGIEDRGMPQARCTLTCHVASLMYAYWMSRRGCQSKVSQLRRLKDNNGQTIAELHVLGAICIGLRTCPAPASSAATSGCAGAAVWPPAASGSRACSSSLPPVPPGSKQVSTGEYHEQSTQSPVS